MGIVTRTVGDRGTFAIEFSVDVSQREPRNFWSGTLGLWVSNNFLGDSNVTEMPVIGLSSLQEAASVSGKLSSKILSSLPPAQALDLVMWARYGDDNPELQRMAGRREEWDLFEVLPLRAGPFFENWQAIMIEEGTTERFVYRRLKDQVSEARWTLGTFRDVVADASLQFAEVSDNGKD